MMICQLVNSHQRFGGAFYFHLQGLRRPKKALNLEAEIRSTYGNLCQFT